MMSKLNKFGLPLGEDNRVHMYGLNWPENAMRLRIELECFKRHLDKPKDKGMPNTEDASEHFWTIANIIAKWDAKKKTGFCRHPWAERMVDAACRYNMLGISGPGSSGKTEFAGMWAIQNFLADPVNTLILATTTDLESGRRRVWGSIEKIWTRLPFLPPGKLTKHPPMIRFNGNNGKGNSSSINLLPSSPKHAVESSGKLIGLKNERVILIIDEMSEISEAVCSAMFNLKSNPHFSAIGMTNHSSWLTPFSHLSNPKAGIASVSVEDKSWETEKGFCIHIDGLEAYEINKDGQYPILSAETLDKDTTPNKERDPGFWRFVRSFPPPSGNDDTVFCEADVHKFGGMNGPVIWKGLPIMVAGLDPSYSNNGDRCSAFFCKYGMDKDERMVIEAYKHVILRADTSSKEPSQYQKINKFIHLCEDMGVEASHVAVDATAGGNLFCDILAGQWGTSVFERVNFGKTASDNERVSIHDDRMAKEVYGDQATELWMGARRFLENEQIRSMPTSLVRELCARKMLYDKRLLRLEPKREMMALPNRSPDEADSFVLAVAVCQRRLGAIPGGGDKQQAGNGKIKRTFVQMLRKYDVCAHSPMFRSSKTKAWG